MQSIPREDVPVVIDDNGVEVRLRDEDGLSVGFVHVGRTQDFAAGEAFYWAAGHAPEALEDSEYVDFPRSRSSGR